MGSFSDPWNIRKFLDFFSPRLADGHAQAALIPTSNDLASRRVNGAPPPKKRTPKNTWSLSF